MQLKPSIIGVSLLSSGGIAWDFTNERDFRRGISGHNHALVAFIHPSPTAIQCQTLEPEWQIVADSHSSLLTIDCSSEKVLCDEFDIVSYPAIRYFDGHGHTRSYRGPRKAPAIKAFLSRAHRPVTTTLNLEKMAGFQSVDERVIVGQFNPKDEHIITAFKTVAPQYRDRATFGSIEIDGASTVECYNNVDEQKFTSTDFTAVDELSKLVETCLPPLIGEFNRMNEMSYLQAGKSLVYYFSTTQEERDDYVKMIRPVAKMYKEYLNFVTVDALEYGDLAGPLGLTPGVFPALAVQNPMFGQVFPMPEITQITSESVGAFVMDIVQGKVRPWDGQHSRGNTQGQGQEQGHDEL
ncbi:thioredoxin-like domain-containing protein [Xylariaceae sp. FL1019]|nr:thioredoxin-like domain-containing protein [Xylariaceae sp. FL1019]